MAEVVRVFSVYFTPGYLDPAQGYDWLHGHHSTQIAVHEGE